MSDNTQNKGEPAIVLCYWRFASIYEKNRRAISRVLCPQEITGVTSLKRVLIIYPHAPSLMRSIVLPSGALCSRGTKSRTGNPHSPVYMNFQPPMCTARMSPHDWWALTPPSHPYLWSCHLEYKTRQGGCFLLHDLTLTDYFPLRSGAPCAARTFLLHHLHCTKGNGVHAISCSSVYFFSRQVNK